jgi:hypothetical protein
MTAVNADAADDRLFPKAYRQRFAGFQMEDCHGFAIACTQLPLSL